MAKNNQNFRSSSVQPVSKEADGSNEFNLYCNRALSQDKQISTFSNNSIYDYHQSRKKCLLDNNVSSTFDTNKHYQSQDYPNSSILKPFYS